MTLKFHTNVTIWLKLNAKKFWVLIFKFAEVPVEIPVEGLSNDLLRADLSSVLSKENITLEITNPRSFTRIFNFK